MVISGAGKTTWEGVVPRRAPQSQKLLLYSCTWGNSATLIVACRCLVIELEMPIIPTLL